MRVGVPDLHKQSFLSPFQQLEDEIHLLVRNEKLMRHTSSVQESWVNPRPSLTIGSRAKQTSPRKQLDPPRLGLLAGDQKNNLTPS
jgi:hypothetical protein